MKTGGLDLTPNDIAAGAHACVSWIPSGVYRLGSDRHYREEQPARDVRVMGFWIERTAVTNAAFAAFVDATSYITVAERPLDPAAYPGVDPRMLVPGALVFRTSAGPVNLRDVSQWWFYVPGACWRCPEGPGSDLSGRAGHPVVQVAFEDAAAYAAWRGMALPSEAEWEAAARGGLERAEFVWGDAFLPAGRHMANTWQGEFPWQNSCEDGHAGTSPVTYYPPNGYGIYDMAGNVWEWTRDPYFVGDRRYAAGHPCCVPNRTIDLAVDASSNKTAFSAGLTSNVIKGGSFLCAPNYCRRYRPAARQPQMIDTATNHIGFRCVAHGDGPR